MNDIEQTARELRRRAQIMRDTAQMKTQHPAWLLRELELAATALEDAADALSQQPALIVSGSYPHANGDTWYMLADLIAGRSGPNGEPMYKTRDRVVPAFAAPKAPAGFVLVPVETLRDLAEDVEEYVRSTEFRPARIEKKLTVVREAQAMLAAKPEHQP